MTVTCHDTYDDEVYERSAMAPAVGAQCHDPVGDACMEMLLAEEVRRWAESVAQEEEEGLAEARAS